MKKLPQLIVIFSVLLTSCTQREKDRITFPQETSLSSTPAPVSTASYSTRPAYQPGELVDYTAQTGDTLPALASHFNTTVREIKEANPFIPQDVTTLPPGMPMKIPIYYQTLWGNPTQIIPDSLFVNGPAQVGFDAAAFTYEQPGWLRQYTDVAGGVTTQGGSLVTVVAVNFSISPRLLLAIIEYQTHALTDFNPPDTENNLYPLGYKDRSHQGLYQQLLWAANILNNGYYQWRKGTLNSFDLVDGRMERPDPWQNAATVAIHYYFSKALSADDYAKAIDGGGFAFTYQKLFGDPWKDVKPHIPGSLRQPTLNLPFLAGKIWAYTGGPHTGWGDGEPWAAIDFAPPSTLSGCAPSLEYATAVADGIISRTDTGIAVLDLDGDNDERTGWVIFYLHLATLDMVKAGTVVKAGDPMGHPSCEGGHATGSHVHIARKYNGEWILASGPLALNLQGWVAEDGSKAYQGTLRRYSGLIQACECADHDSQIKAEGTPQPGN